MNKILIPCVLLLWGCINKEIRNPSSEDNKCESQISASQVRDEIVGSLTSLETKLDEVSVLKINSIDVRVEGNRKTVVLKYTLTLLEPSRLSQSIQLSDPERRKIEVAINANLPCIPRSVSARGILLDGQRYNDIPDDDRDGLGAFNENNKNSLVIESPN